MALGTLPRPGRTLSGAMTDSVDIVEEGAAAWRSGLRPNLGWLARIFAGFHLGGLGILLMTAWRGTETAGTTVAGLPAFHLAFLMATGAAAAALTLIDRDHRRL